MNNKDFTKPSGKLIEAQDPIIGDYHYFMPDEPKADISLNQETIILLTEAERHFGSLKYLSGAGSVLPDPQVFIDPNLYLTKEAVLSSIIEGTQTTVSDVLKSQIQQKKDVGMDEKEVENYIKALKYGMAKIQTSKIDYTLIKEMHKILLTNVRGEDKDPGEFRRVQNWIGSKDDDIHKATIVPPSPSALIKTVHDFIDYLERKDLPLLVQTAIMHYYFEIMHPFRDGNGRIGRLLIVLFLCKRKALDSPILYLSAYFEKYRSEYYKRLLNVSQKSEFEEWIRFFLKAVKIQSEDVCIRAGKLTKLRKNYFDKLVDMEASSKAIKALDLLFVNTYISIKELEGKLETTFPTAKKAIEDLIAAGIVKEITGKERYKLFCAEEILNIIQR